MPSSSCARRSFAGQRRIEEICPDLADAPESAGDWRSATWRSFGTWRDCEGRLVWGVNDFDEGGGDALSVRPGSASDQRAPGARPCAGQSQRPPQSFSKATATDSPIPGRSCWTSRKPGCVNTWSARTQGRAKFWDKVDGYPDADPPVEVQAALRASMPKDARDVRFATRRKGGGSLGRPRYVAIAKWRGGRIVREAKALAPSAWDWAHAVDQPVSRAMELSTSAYRSPDPHFAVVPTALSSAGWRRIRARSVSATMRARSCRPAYCVSWASISAPFMPPTGARRQDRSASRWLPKDWLRENARNATTEVAADFRAWRVQARRWNKTAARPGVPSPVGDAIP